MHPDRCNTSINFQTNNTHRLPHNRAYSCTNPSCLSRPCTFVRLSRWWSVLDRNNMLRPHYYTTVAMWMVRVPTDPLLDSNVKCERLGVATNDSPSVSRSVNQNMPPTHWLIVVRRHSSQSCRCTLCWAGIDRAWDGTVMLSARHLSFLVCQCSCRRCLPLRIGPTWVSSCRVVTTAYKALCDSYSFPSRVWSSWSCCCCCGCTMVIPFECVHVQSKTTEETNTSFTITTKPLQHSRCQQQQWHRLTQRTKQGIVLL